MQLASSIIRKRINVLAVLFIGFSSMVEAQDLNSPYSRYGLGDILPSQNILTRGMGGIGTAYYDYRSVNFLNPAAYSNLQTVTLDIGIEVDNLTIKSLNPVAKYSNASPQISYLTLGLPLIKRKNFQTGGKEPMLGLAFGLRPMTKISYQIQRVTQFNGTTGSDSIATLFQGQGGTQQVFAGLGLKLKNFSIGANAGYLFGSKDYSTRTVFLLDTVTYQKSNHQTTSNFNGFFFNAGAQYTIQFNKKTFLRLGVQGNWQQDVKATNNYIVETFDYDPNGGPFRIDSVYGKDDGNGTVTLPASYSAGIILDNQGKWSIGIDYNIAKWSQYRYFNETDQVQDSWDVRLGGQIFPTSGKSYWSNVAYRAGVSYGEDYVNVGNVMPKWSVSFGAGLPLRNVPYTNQSTIINTSFEIGRRGNDKNPVQENFFRVAVGLSMSDIWFIKRKYD